jgi:hypothetical protein
MSAIGVDRFRSTAAAVPDFGASSGGGMNEDFKRFDAIEKALGELRTSVVAVNGKVDALSVKVDATNATVDATNAKVDALIATVAATNARVDATNAKVDALIATVAATNATVAALSMKIDATLPHLATKADLHGVRAEVQTVRGDMIRWVTGAIVAALVSGVVQIISRLPSH